MPIPLSRLRVLVVDDDPPVADSLSAILRQQRHQVCTAYNAEQALDIVAEFAPQAVISDVLLPGMDGVQLAMQLYRRFPDCKILLYSGNAGLHDLLTETAAREGHVINVLPKPIHPRVLLDFVNSCV